MNTTRRRVLLALVPPLVLCLAALLLLLSSRNVDLFLAIRTPLLGFGAPFWSGITLAGDALVAPLLLIPFLRRRPELLWEGLLAALAATAFTHLLKPLVHMPRPPAVLDDLPVIGTRLLSGAFPSGHTATAFTLLGVLVLSGLLRGRGAVLIGVALSSLVGLSRIVVGAHWPADVLAGAAGGWCSAAAGLGMAARWPLAHQPWIRGILRMLLAVIALLDLFGHETGYPQGLWLQHSIAVLALAGLAWQGLDDA